MNSILKRVFAILFTVIVFYETSYTQSNTILRTYISAAGQAMNNNKANDAIMQLKYAASIAPENFVPLYLLGQVYVSLNDYNNAAKYCTDALNIIDANTMSQKFFECYGRNENVSYRKVMTGIYDILAIHYKEVGQIGLAKRYNNLNIQLNIASGYKAPVVSSLQRMYLCYAEEGNWSECLKYFSEIQMIIPHGGAWGMCEAVCHAAMGDCYAKLGRGTETISEYQRAAKLGHLGARQVLKNMGLTD